MAPPPKAPRDIQITISPHPAFQAALQERLAATTHQTKALAEEKLWQTAIPADRKALGKDTWVRIALKDHCHDSESTIHRRAELIKAPSCLWLKVNSGEYVLGTAQRLYSEAKRAAKIDGTDLDTAMAAVIANYEKLPVASFNTHGQKIRKRTATTHLRGKNIDALKEGQGQGWWHRMRQVLGNIVADKVPANIDEFDRTKLYNWLDHEISLLVEQFSLKAARAKKENTPETIISRKAIIDACRTLFVDPPKPNGPIDLVAARRAKLELARSYHPDSNGGNESLRAAYTNVIEAYCVLESYSQKFGSTTKLRDKRAPKKEESSPP